MARAKWCGAEIYDAAAAFKERCLVGDDSLFAPDSAVWTPAQVRAVADRAGVEDLGSGSFIEKLETRERQRVCVGMIEQEHHADQEPPVEQQDR